MATTTTTLLASLASLTAMACAPIGNKAGDDNSGPDAGVSAKPCDDPAIKTGNVTLTGSDSSVTNLPTGCWQLNGSLTLNGSVASLAKLGDLRQVKDLIVNGSNLTSIDMDAPLAVTGKLDIENTKLTSLEGLQLPDDASCLTYLSSVNITANPGLTDLGGVANLMCVSGAVTIQNNVELTQVRLDSALRLEGGLKVADNTRMTSLSVGANSITGDLTIQHNAALTAISLAKLHFMHGSIIIDDNDLLTTLPTELLSPAPMVESSLTITNNAKLTELGQLTHLSAVNYVINITNNPQLDYCEAREIGCCVSHPNTASISTGNKNHTCSTSAAKPWCYADHGNSCPYLYSN
ncbi:MAG: hypothetical protein ABI678_19445 [Kofleriaceae bacterium]